MQIFVITYDYMYFCHMKNKPTLTQISFNTDDSYKQRYLIIVETKDEEVPRLHLVYIPQWLVYYSKEYKYYAINWN
jgi:hypothetical protein